MPKWPPSTSFATTSMANGTTPSNRTHPKIERLIPDRSFAVKASDLEAIRTAVVDAAAVSAGAESGNRRAARRQRNVATESEFGAWSGAIEETGGGEYAIPPSGRPIIVGATSQMAFAR